MRRGLAAAALCAAAAPAAAAPAIVADLSSREIAITTGFTGADLLLFGAADGPGDVVVTVSGPRRDVVVRRKQRIAGVWVNGASVTFRGAPAYYRVAASRPLGEIAPPAVLRRLGIGADALGIAAASARPPEELAEFRAALFRNKQRLGLYGAEAAGVGIVRGRLFRTTVPFPSNVPTGEYVASVFLFRDGALVSRERTPLAVRKGGLGERIFSFAHERSALYGAAAILIALAAGWIAGAVFRRP